MVNGKKPWQESLANSSWRCSYAENQWADRSWLHQQRLLLGSYDDFIAKVIANLSVEHTDTVLDVGAGPGTLAIPLSRRAKMVTCLDISEAMLAFARENARRAGAKNIAFIKGAWEEVEIGRHVAKHDIAIACRFVPHNLKEGLAKLGEAAAKWACVIWGSGWNPVDEAVCRAIGRKYCPLPGYPRIIAALNSLGVRPKTASVSAVLTYRYQDMEAVLADWHWGLGDLTRHEQERLEEHLEKVLVDRGAFLELAGGQTKWMVISWDVAKEP